MATPGTNGGAFLVGRRFFVSVSSDFATPADACICDYMDFMLHPQHALDVIAIGWSSGFASCCHGTMWAFLGII